MADHVDPDLPPTSPDPIRAARIVLFTAFEPSGDEHASHVIAELRHRHPDPDRLAIVAWGGPKMAAAGAILMERTVDEGVMGIPGLARIQEHLRVMARIDAWMSAIAAARPADLPAPLHVPVDSPGANNPICDLAKKNKFRVVHLVAPQVWAWGRWRVAKLRRRTDLLLCLFDFEIRFFSRRNIPARYIGHPFFDVPLDTDGLDRKAAAYPSGTPKLAIFPGSRPAEITKHFPLTLDAFRKIKAMWADAVGVVAATNEQAERVMREIAATDREGWPDGLRIVVGESEAVIRWCDLAIVKSGTTTLQVARQHKPMVIFYRKGGRIFNILVRIIIATKQFALPNILARRHIVPELIPYHGGSGRLVQEVARILRSPELMEQQRQDLRQVVAPLTAGGASVRAADAIEEFLGIRPVAAAT